MNVSNIFTLAGAIIFGVIIADILIHPVGTQAAANGLATIAKPTYSALLGTAPS